MKSKNIKCVALALNISISINVFACKECNDRGYVYDIIECPLCEGHGTVSPAYYGNAAGITRWTVEELFIRGIKVAEFELDKKYKKYTFGKCPVCCKSKKPRYIN